MTKSIVYIDSEIGIEDKKIKDLGAIKENRSSFHAPSVRVFARPGVKFCVSVFRQSQEWSWKTGRILA